MHYVGTTKHDRMGHIASLGRVEWGQNVAMDGFTIRNLELLGPNPSRKAQLGRHPGPVGHPDGGDACCAGGSPNPCVMPRRIVRRHEAVAAFLDSPQMRADLIAELRSHRRLWNGLLAKTAAVRISPAELKKLRQH